MSTERFDKVIARADRVMRQLDERDGAVWIRLDSPA